jgi:deoxyadenosine/deoxycytidine kinase
MSANYKIVSIEGNIGSGKSTLLENLRKHYSNNQRVIFLREPVDDWEKIKDKDGNTMLKKFYADQEKYSFAFQIMAYISRLKILRDTVKEITQKTSDIVTKRFNEMCSEETCDRNFKLEEYIIITERSLYTDKYVFAKMLYDQGKIEDVCYQIYLNWFEEFAKDFPINYSVYVNTEPNKCYGRIHKRAREGEELIPLHYLTDCHNYHEEFLDENSGIKMSKLVLDGNVDIYENEKIVEEWLEQINLFIQQ